MITVEHSQHNIYQILKKSNSLKISDFDFTISGPGEGKLKFKNTILKKVFDIPTNHGIIDDVFFYSLNLNENMIRLNIKIDLEKIESILKKKRFNYN